MEWEFDEGFRGSGEGEGVTEGRREGGRGRGGEWERG